MAGTIAVQFINLSHCDRVEADVKASDTINNSDNNSEEVAIDSFKTNIKGKVWKDFVDKVLEYDTVNLINIGVGLVLIVTALVMIVVRLSKRKKPVKVANKPVENASRNAHENIVIRRKTVSILRTQSLEDVQDNPAYMKIDCADFCNDSAVRRIYLKNTCVKDIYNMYADDLRNPDNPKENGCMVLGRWVYDQQYDEYYVSLEEIVKPGDDAVFKEYELNFGGKIKLKVADRLRRLRTDSNLQYDMTCWVHSHPGLGVFFSNADSVVQMQLKNPTHPKFLVAIVIDVLTPNQELGIFTFRHDETVNSRPDIKKMYSLEDFYKWAVKSDRNSFKEEDYYNIMSKTELRTDDCSGIELSNGAIIDICQMALEQETGLVGRVHGFVAKKGMRKELVINAVTKEEVVADNEMLGCFVMGRHRSIPTICKAVADYDGVIKFVLFYSTADDLLTSIPFVEGTLCVDEKYYGEEKLEDLKIWTRRRR